MTTHVPNTFSRKYTIFSPQVRHREYDNRKTGRNLPAPLHTRRTSGHAAQRIAPEQQLSVLDFAFAYVVLREVVRYYGRDYTIRSVTLIRHAEIFRTEGFAAIREWKQYVAMQYDNKRPQP